ncbi:Hypothetical protein A7982_04870 [Minicystis rosea]|nr:Hypothetical protein A7982_04870 [Minicystis rosea]
MGSLSDRAGRGGSRKTHDCLHPKRGLHGIRGLLSAFRRSPKSARLWTNFMAGGCRVRRGQMACPCRSDGLVASVP